MGLRKFNSGAVRSSSEGKIDWFGVRHPLVENSFGNYMKKHTVTEDGSKREFNNWWGGWDKKVSLQSMIRHMEDLQAINSGLIVVKKRNAQGESTIYVRPGQVIVQDKDDIIEPVSEEDCVNAIRFNCGAYLLDLLKNK